jgi:hypothetical protein
MMKAIDRVMRAYSKSRYLTDEQAASIRIGLSKFIHELMLGRGAPKRSTEARERKRAFSHPIKSTDIRSMPDPLKSMGSAGWLTGKSK